MIIGICGYGYSGSGAVIDLLKEYEDAQVNDDFEFTLSYWPDSLEDLELHLVKNPSRFWGCDIAIKRFKEYVKKEQNMSPGWYRKALGKNANFLELSNEFINEITQVSWKGKWMIEGYFCGKLDRILKFNLLPRMEKVIPSLGKLTDRDMYFSIEPENFYMACRKYTEKILINMGYDLSKVVVLNQPFAANNPLSSMKFYKKSKALIVDRDPRDIYFLMKLHTKSKWAPTENVEDFIIYYKNMRRNILEHESVLYLNFEELVYNYETTKKRIEEFCEIKNQIRKYQFFDPKISINNTQLYKRYPQYEEDTRKIEENLKEYLFDFSPYEKIVLNGQIF